MNVHKQNNYDNKIMHIHNMKPIVEEVKIPRRDKKHQLGKYSIIW